MVQRRSARLGEIYLQERKLVDGALAVCPTPNKNRRNGEKQE
jgi:hypothetical protein